MTAAEILGLPRNAPADQVRAAALRELDLPANSSHEAVRKAYRQRALELHPDRVTQTPAIRRRWQRLQAAVLVLRPPPDRLTDEERRLWQETADFAEPFTAGMVEEIGQLLSGWTDSIRRPGTDARTGLPKKGSAIREVAADTAKAAVASGQRVVMGKLSQFFRRLREDGSP